MSEENTYTAESESIYFLNGKNIATSLSASGQRDPIPSLDLAKTEFAADRARLDAAESDIGTLSSEIEAKVTAEAERAEAVEEELSAGIAENASEIARVDEKTRDFTNGWKADVDTTLASHGERLDSLEADTAELSADLATESLTRHSDDVVLSGMVEDTKAELKGDIAALSGKYVDVTGDTMTGDLVIDQASLKVLGDGLEHGGKIQANDISVVNNVTVGKGSSSPHDKTFVFNGTDESYASQGVGTFNINPINGYAGIYVGTSTVSALVQEERGKTTSHIADVSAYLNSRDTAIENSLTATQVTVGTHYTEFNNFKDSTTTKLGELDETDAAIRNEFAEADQNLSVELEALISQARADFTAADTGLKAGYEAADAELSSDIEDLRADTDTAITEVKQNLIGSVRYRGHITINDLTETQPISAIIGNHKHYSPDTVLENGFAYKFSVSTPSGKYITTEGIEITDNDYIIIDNHLAPFSVVLSDLNRDTIDIVNTLDSDVVRMHHLDEVSTFLSGSIDTLSAELNEKLVLSVGNLTTKIDEDVAALRTDHETDITAINATIANTQLSVSDNRRDIDILSGNQMSAMVFDGILAFDPATIEQYLRDNFGITDTNLSSLFKAANLGDKTYRKIKNGYSYHVKINTTNARGERIYTTQDGVYLSDNDLIIIDTDKELEVEQLQARNARVVHSDREDNVRWWNHLELSAEMIERIDAERQRAEAVEEALSAAIDAETARATLAEAYLSAAIDTERARALSAEAALDEKIETETSRALSAEADLDEKIEAETSRALSAEAQLSADLTEKIETETSRALSTEAQLSANLTEKIEAETARALSTETDLSTALNNEAEARALADQELSTAIDNEVSARTDLEDDLSSKISNIHDELDVLDTRCDQLESEISAGITLDDSLTEKADQLYHNLTTNFDTVYPDGISIDDMRTMLADFFDVLRKL